MDLDGQPDVEVPRVLAGVDVAVLAREDDRGGGRVPGDDPGERPVAARLRLADPDGVRDRRVDVLELHRQRRRGRGAGRLDAVTTDDGPGEAVGLGPEGYRRPHLDVPAGEQGLAGVVEGPEGGPGDEAVGRGFVRRVDAHRVEAGDGRPAQGHGVAGLDGPGDVGGDGRLEDDLRLRRRHAVRPDLEDEGPEGVIRRREGERRADPHGGRTEPGGPVALDGRELQPEDDALGPHVGRRAPRERAHDRHGVTADPVGVADRDVPGDGRRDGRRGDHRRLGRGEGAAAGRPLGDPPGDLVREGLDGQRLAGEERVAAEGELDAAAPGDGLLADELCADDDLGGVPGRAEVDVGDGKVVRRVLEAHGVAHVDAVDEVARLGPEVDGGVADRRLRGRREGVDEGHAGDDDSDDEQNGEGVDDVDEAEDVALVVDEVHQGASAGGIGAGTR